MTDFSRQDNLLPPIGFWDPKLVVCKWLPCVVTGTLCCEQCYYHGDLSMSSSESR
jgi:hypothetical protein